MDALARTIGSTRSGQLRAEAIWAIRSAEGLGKSLLSEIIIRTDGAFSSDTPGLGDEQSFATPRFGVTARLVPASNCFNTNALAVVNDESALVINEPAYQQYVMLLRAVGLFEGEALSLADALADWIDEDDVPRSSGAESRTYQNRDVSYRSSGQMLSNMTELRSVEGYTREVLLQFDHLLCAYPSATQNTLNLNLLEPNQAPLLHAMFSNELSVDVAMRIIEARPTGGWISIQEFMEIPEIQQIAPHAKMPENVGVRSRYFAMDVDLISSDQAAYGEFLFELLPTGEIVTVRRREGGQR